MKFRIRISTRAASEIDRASKWWRLHREKAPDAFDEDLEDALVLIRTNPDAGRRVRGTRRRIRALWLGRIGYFLYYSVSDDGVVEILAIWHASRGSRPRL